MSEVDDAETPKRSFSFCLALLVALPLLYLASVGPVVAIWDKTHGFGGTVSQQFVLNLYFPVVWLHEKTSMRGPIESYLALWGVK